VFAARSREGRAVLTVINRPGVWQRAGMSAVLVGLDLPHALHRYRADAIGLSPVSCS